MTFDGFCFGVSGNLSAHWKCKIEINLEPGLGSVHHEAAWFRKYPFFKIQLQTSHLKMCFIAKLWGTIEQKVCVCLTLIAVRAVILTSWKELNPALFEKRICILSWTDKNEAQTRNRDVLFFSVNLIAMLRIPNYAIISHTKDSQQHRNWPLFHSVPADAVWIKQQHGCSHTALTVWRHRSSVSLFVSVFCKVGVFCSVNLIISFVSFGAKGQQFWRNHSGS